MTEDFQKGMPRLSVPQLSVPATERYKLYIGGRPQGKRLSELIHGDVLVAKKYLQELADIRRKAKEEYYRKQEKDRNEST